MRRLHQRLKKLLTSTLFRLGFSVSDIGSVLVDSWKPFRIIRS
jgi:hypothetical protein